MRAGVPHRRWSPIRMQLLDAFPIDGDWVTVHDLVKEVYAPTASVQRYVREFIDGKLVERGDSVPYGKSWTYQFRLTKLGINREGSVKHPRTEPPLAAVVVYAERLLPNRYEGVGGRPGPIDQRCTTCNARVNRRCFDMGRGKRGESRDARNKHWKHLDRPHKSRRAWRGHSRNRVQADVLTLTWIDQACTRCLAPKGERCFQLTRTGGRMAGNQRCLHPHSERTDW